MKDFENIWSSLKEIGWDEKSCILGALDWEEIVQDIPVGSKISNIETGETGTTADGGFYDNYNADFPVININGIEGASANWPPAKVELFIDKATSHR